MPETQHFILATAGHVDHGKSSLVKALTGLDPDRLPEEKARGMTIDLGFAHLELPDPSRPSASFLLGIIDVPGHEDFVKNMVAGVGSVDLALFVVAADDGWMPQTEEHLQILTHLGVGRAVVALTKVDLAQDECTATAGIRDKLRGTPFADAPIVPTSVISGRGLDELKAILTQLLVDTPRPRDFGKPRLPVDRVFKLPGIGTVVTGTLTGGILRRGQTVTIQPSGKTTRIRNIQSHRHDVDASGPGMRTALNLPELKAIEIHRGDVITLPELGGPSETLDVYVKISPRANHPLKNDARVRLHHGSGNVAGRVAFWGEKELAVGECAPAQLQLEAPTFIFAGDRCILRDWAEQRTLAGAVVLDPDASRKGFRNEARRVFLDRRSHALDSVVIFVASHVARDGAVRRAQLLLKSRFSDAAVAEAIVQLTAEGKNVVVGDFIVDTATWTALRERAANVIEVRHRAHPEHTGLSLSELRATIAGDLPFDELFEPLIQDLCRHGFEQAGVLIRSATHRIQLPPRLQADAGRLRAALTAHPFEPPSRKSLVPDSISQQALRFLIETGDVVEINEDLVMAAESVRTATEQIRRFIREHGPATVSDLRRALGSSRRVTVPLLERLDRDGVTLRKGDTRTVR